MPYQAVMYPDKMLPVMHLLEMLRVSSDVIYKPELERNLDAQLLMYRE